MFNMDQKHNEYEMENSAMDQKIEEQISNGVLILHICSHAHMHTVSVYLWNNKPHDL